MDFKLLFDFLYDLNADGHNDKSWMDAHRKEYHQTRNMYIDFLDELNEVLKKSDPDYTDTPGRKAINRINNNKVFKPDAPTYKDHFGASLDKVLEKTDFYIHIGINGSFVATGFYHAPNEKLKLVRQEIDYNGDELDEILNEPRFKEKFGGLWMEDSLKTTPQGYKKDHPRIDMLRLKSFVIQRDFTEDEIKNSSFEDDLIETYQLMLPFRKFLDQSLDG
ncbi:MAG: DUF2461 domain-containing protein [Bacteroidota bacterium]